MYVISVRANRESKREEKGTRAQLKKAPVLCGGSSGLQTTASPASVQMIASLWNDVTPLALSTRKAWGAGEGEWKNGHSCAENIVPAVVPSVLPHLRLVGSWLGDGRGPVFRTSVGHACTEKPPEALCILRCQGLVVIMMIDSKHDSTHMTL